MTYIYIGSRTKLFELDTTKIFLNKQNLKSYADSICSEKSRYSISKTGQSGFCGLRLLSWTSSLFVP
jgi:hypothetical protein